MYNLLVYLKVVAEYSKDVHYNLSGLSFIANHEYMDKVNEDALNYIDEINEQYYMANGLSVPRSTNVMESAIKITPEIGDNALMIENLLKSIKSVIYSCEENSKNNDGDILSKTALGDLLGRISSSFSKHYGLLSKIVT